MSAGSAPGAAAKDKVSLPFACSVEAGRLRVEPAGDHEYAIAGPRDEQSFTFCPQGEGGRCHTWMVHRFAVQCVGGRVAWQEIVAAAARHVNGRATIENGQLVLRLAARPLAGNSGRCPQFARSTGGIATVQAGCQITEPAAIRRTHILAMPRGYAPLGLVGGRIVLDAEPPRSARPARAPAAEPIVPPVALPALPERLRDAVVSEALTEPVMPAAPEPMTAMIPHGPSPSPPSRPVETPSLTPTPMAVTPPKAAAHDGAVLEPIVFTQRAEAATFVARRDEATDGSHVSFAQVYALALAATALLAFTAVSMRRRRWRHARWQPSHPSGAADGDGQRAIALRHKAEGHISLIASALDRLAVLAPLRNALARDLQSSERRLAVVVAAISAKSGVDEQAWTRARRRLERIAQDLDRLQAIAESAVSSLSGLGAVRALPRNKDEAYLTLGVTPGVSDAILKRLVEALRISWHPDLATSDADRAARDVRIKEINVAWDLITGKRESE